MSRTSRSSGPARPAIGVAVLALGALGWVLLERSGRVSETDDAALQAPIYLDPDAPLAARVDDLLGRLTLEEKVGQLVTHAPAIERLGVPKHNFWNECLHGLQGPPSGPPTTVFPQSIGLAAMWDPRRIQRMAEVISDEARALHHHAAAAGRRGLGTGLTMFAPTLNILRDPRWGRSQETFGEDPHLTARLAVAYVRGLQGDHPVYLKTIATPKHFAAHSGPESQRDTFTAVVSPRDLFDTYLPAFRAALVEGRAGSVMCAYNGLNEAPCCVNTMLLRDILRTRWKFDGYVVADCGAVEDLYKVRRVTVDGATAAAQATTAGCDLACFMSRRKEWLDAVDRGLLGDSDVDPAVRRLLAARIRLGQLDPPERVPYARTAIDVLCRPEHTALARDLARASIVLLENDAVLPLNPATATIAVVGPNADDPRRTLLGSYHGIAPHVITPLAGIRAAAPAATVRHAPGCGRVRIDPALRAAAVAAADAADVVICCLGLSAGDTYEILLDGEEPGLEGEALPTEIPGFHHGDRTRLTLPEAQVDLLRAVVGTGTPVVVVLLNGGPLSFHGPTYGVRAVIEAWYPGQEGGHALADVLFGGSNPAGRLPMTVYHSAQDLPPFEDYAMAGRTYRYFEGEPLYPFGYGLSYTTFDYGPVTVEPPRAAPGDTVTVRATITNRGPRSGDEVVQLYVTDVEASAPVARVALQGFRRVHLEPGQHRTVVFTLEPRHLSMVDGALRRVVEPGRFDITVGPHSPTPARPVGSRATLDLAGEPVILQE